MARAKEIPYTQEQLKGLFDYNPETGCLLWRSRDISWFVDERAMKIWNTRYAGKVAGRHSQRISGYKIWILRLEGRGYLAHRVVWKYMTGEEPPKSIDHIDHDTSNNRWSNLQDGSDNSRNLSLSQYSESGYVGVSRTKCGTQWRARGYDNKKEYFLGAFDDVHEAGKVAKEWRLAHGYHENHGIKREYNY